MSSPGAPTIVSTENSTLVLSLAEDLYPLETVYGAAYVFIDRAYILLGKTAEGITVTLQTKDLADNAEALRVLAGEFSNELLSQALRRTITQAHRPMLETIVSQALAGATGAVIPSAFDDDDDDDLDFLDDPLGIAVPWEEKFKKSGSEPAKAGPDAERPPGPADAGGHSPSGPTETSS